MKIKKYENNYINEWELEGGNIMKKLSKIICKVLPIVLVGLLVVGNVFGIGAPSAPSKGTPADGVTGVAKNVWGTAVTIIQILAVAAVVFAGIRYMFASANDKADIKKQMVILVIGAVLVFGATFVLRIISDASTKIIPASGT